MPASKMFAKPLALDLRTHPNFIPNFDRDRSVSDRDSSQQATLAAPAYAYLDSVDNFWQLWQQMPASKMFAKPLALDLRTHPNFIPLFYGDRSSSDRDSSQQATLVAPPDAYLNSVDDFLQLWQQMPSSKMCDKPLALDLRTHPNFISLFD